MSLLDEATELELLRQAISLARCMLCEATLEEQQWVLADWTEQYTPATEYARPTWMRERNQWQADHTDLLCPYCADVSTSRPQLTWHSGYRNLRGPGAALVGHLEVDTC